MKTIILIMLASMPVTLCAQSGPGGVASGSTGVLLWLNGKSVNSNGTNPTIGATVSTWFDKSGNGVNVTENQANVATYSANGVTFNGTGYLTGSDATFPTGSSARTVIVCASSPSTAEDDVIFFYGTGANNQSYGIAKLTSAGGTPNGIRNYFFANDFDVAGGFTPSGTLKIITTTYTSNTQMVYINNNAGVTNTPTIPNTTLGAQGVQIGGWSSFGLHSLSTIGEVIVYNKVLNSAERIIVNNYLSAKNGLTLAANDLYDNDDVGNGNFDFDVAGIGRGAAAGETNTDAQSNIVRINNATGINANGEFYIWGHDNGTLATTTSTGLPAALQARMTRIWRGSETGTITNFDVRFDLTGLGAVTLAQLRLLIDTNNDGSFADETVGTGGIVGPPTSLGSNVYQFATVTAINNDNRFTIATTNSTTTPLPVKLLNFSAIHNEGNVDLEWTTASEKMNDYFTVERTKDGREFEPVGTVDGAGDSDSKNKYNLTDQNPFVGQSHYRLSQTDYDGTKEYFPLITVVVPDVEVPFRIHPNPSNGNFTIELSGATDERSTILSIYDLRGVEMFSSLLSPVQKTNSSVAISLESKLSPGLYFVKIKSDNTQRVLKLLIE